MSFSNYFFNKTDLLTVFLGAKGGGKTHTLLRILFLKDAVGAFEEIHFCCPHYEDEQNGSYACLKNFKTPLFIHKAYSADLGNELIARQRDKKTGSIALVVDDGTSQNLFRDKSLINFATTSRHCRITVYLVAHADRSVLPPILRKNIDYWFVFYAQTPLLKTIYEDVMSRYEDFPSFKQFDAWFRECVDGIKYNALFIDTREREYSATVKGWFPKDLLEQK